MKKTAPRKKVARRRPPVVDALDEGDSVGYSMSVFAKKGRREAWIKVEAGSTVRHGETGEEAAERVAIFCQDAVNADVEEFMT